MVLVISMQGTFSDNNKTSLTKCIHSHKATLWQALLMRKGKVCPFENEDNPCKECILVKMLQSQTRGHDSIFLVPQYKCLKYI